MQETIMTRKEVYKVWRDRKKVLYKGEAYEVCGYCDLEHKGIIVKSVALKDRKSDRCCMWVFLEDVSPVTERSD